MAETLWLDTRDGRWSALLAASARHDVYHEAGYHAVAEGMGEGEARLLVYREDDRFVALPLLLRPIPGAGGLRDAGSVYGYAGPVTSRVPPSAAMIERFQAALAETMAAEGVVSVFSRLHPLLDQEPLLTGLGGLHLHGSTVSIDLDLPLERQAALYSVNHRRNLEKLRRNGFVCRLDAELADLAAFIATYHENMRRVGAGTYYLFEPHYFTLLRQHLGERLLLFVTRQGGAFAGGALFMLTDGIAQYHLGAVSSEHLRFAPLKQLLDSARAPLHARGARVLHLGGGRGGAEDSLFQFKAGFSDRRHPFRTWRWIARPDDYAGLTAARGAGGPPGFFPAYRA